MHPIIAIALKDLKLLLRDKVATFFTFGFPLLFAVIFGSMMAGEDKPRPTALTIVTEETSAEARLLAERLSHRPELAVDVSQAPREEVTALVRSGKTTAMLVLPKGFGAALKAKDPAHPPQVELGIDPAKRSAQGLLSGLVTREVVGMAHGDAQGQWTEPVAIRTTALQGEAKGPANVYAVLFPQSIIWGCLGVLMAFGSSLVAEREGGTLARLLMSPVSRSAVLLGKGLACAVALLAVNVLMLSVAHFRYGVALPHLGLLALAIAGLSACFVGLMLLIAALSPTEQSVRSVGWAVMMVLGMTGGLMIPLMLLPEWMQQLASVNPIKWSILALEGALWRSFSFQQMLLPLGMLLAFGLAAAALGRWKFQRQLDLA